MAQERQEGLRHRGQADHVDVELSPQVLDWKELDRSRDDDAGIVDEAGECTGGAGDGLAGASDGSRISDVEHNVRESGRRLASKRLAIGGLPDAGEDAEADLIQMKRAGRADSGRCPRDEDVAP